MARILLVEDEKKMRAGLRDNLEAEGHEVSEAADGKEGLRAMCEGAYDLVLLDVMLPFMSGFDVLREARERRVGTPVIMLTAKGEEIDRVLGLELGADDYILKPFGLRELLARVKAVLRRRDPGAAPAGSAITLGHLEVSFETYTATRDKRDVPMTAREFEVLKFLWHHRNQTVSRDQLLNEVWGYDAAPTTRTVDNFMLRLRQKIEDDPSQPRHILTVHGTGYRLVP